MLVTTHMAITDKNGSEFLVSLTEMSVVSLFCNRKRNIFP